MLPLAPATYIFGLIVARVFGSRFSPLSSLGMALRVNWPVDSHLLVSIATILPWVGIVLHVIMARKLSAVEEALIIVICVPIITVGITVAIKYAFYSSYTLTPAG